MNLYEHAKSELELMKNNCNDKDELELQEAISKDILEIIELFSKQGHTGGTASYIIGILERLLRYKPISPLTGNDDEWEDISTYQGGTPGWQNKRDPAIFKDENGRAYNVEGKIFSEDLGHTWFSNKNSHIDITFPYSSPIAAECVIIDNKSEREKLLSDILKILSDNNIIKNNTLKVTEDTKLTDLVTDFYIAKDLLYLNYGLSDKRYAIYNNDKLWNVINCILSNKED